jgi:RES domain-containing protein
MVLYRISNCNRADDLSGTGAKLFGGRWNSIGTPMHYMAASRALAALEVLANKNTMNDAPNFCLSIFDVPEESIFAIEIQDLPKNWKKYPAISSLKKMGDEFVKQGKFLLLKVPSAIIEDEYNFLMNVYHPLAKKLKLKEIKPFHFDGRLV